MDEVSIKIKKVKDGAIIPTYSKYGDAGCDLYSIEEFILEPGDICLVHTGIAIEIPYGLEGQIRPRSGKAIKEGLTVVNSPGTVDAGYRDEIRVGIINVSKSMAYIGIGDRIAQLIISPVYTAEFEEVDELSDSERGLGGFGHTGK
jgi:dUTP pyrophosphatase